MTKSTLDIRSFRHTLGSFLTGVTVVTTLDSNNKPIGFTANSFTSVSLEPPLILVCLAKSSYNSAVFLSAKHFAVNILSEEQQLISARFASKVEDRFSSISWSQKVTNSPIIDDCSAWLDCDMHNIIDAGDHYIFIGEVKAFDHDVVAPLGYLRGNYVRFGLQQQAAKAVEDPKHKTIVGLIVESNGRIFLLDETNAVEGLSLPRAPRLGYQSDAHSLSALLNKLKLNIDTKYLFAVFEDKNNNQFSIYYRGETSNAKSNQYGRFYPLDKIPYDKIKEQAVSSMLKRYALEREQDTFGIYIGDEQEGEVEST